MFTKQKQKKLIHLFEEKYLINLHDSEGFMDKAKTAVDITMPKAETYEKSLHNSPTSSQWNAEQIEEAKAVSFPIKGVMDDTRSKLKDVFWETPKKWSKNIASMLSKPVFLLPAWVWGKTTQLPAAITKLVTSGVLVVNAEFWKLLDKPAKLLVKAENKLQNWIGADGTGGAGHGGHAPAHAH